MDINQYQKDRDSDLQNFKKEYAESRAEYTRLLSLAVYEPDPEKQTALVQQVMELNTQLAAMVRAFIGSSNDKFDPKTIADMTKEIMMYQKEYNELKDSKTKQASFESIYDREDEKLSRTRRQFNMFLSILLAGILFIVIMIFITPSGPLISPQEFQSPNTSMTELGATVGGMLRGWS
jgi:predicted TIM-barrel fold metal-dependent hydrolase